MICYLNRGIILEQAICSLLNDYFGKIRLESIRENFNIHITNDHPFAKMIFDSREADSFPAIVVTTQDDRKSDRLGLQPTYDAVEIYKEDLEAISRTTEFVEKNGRTKEIDIPGLCSVVDEATKKEIEKTIDKNGFCCGWSIRTRRTDSICVEIWAENNQVKNEIYEQAREFITGALRHLLAERYPFFAIAIFDDTVVGRRSNNYNYDFDIPLAGAHIAFDVDYCVEQIIIDTELKKTIETITEVNNYVKE